MSDLTRLRSLVLGDSMRLLFSAATLHHLLPNPSLPPPLDTPPPQATLTWLSMAPSCFFGPVLGAAPFTPDDFSELSFGLSDAQSDEVLELLRAAQVPIANAAREDRRPIINRLAAQQGNVSIPPATSPLEVAIVDSLVTAGYPDLDAATGSYNSLRAAGVFSGTQMHTRQGAQTSYAITARYVNGDDSIPVASPWFSEKRVCYACVLLALGPRARHAMVERVDRVTRRTVTSLTSRAMLTDIRTLVNKSVAIIETYPFDPVRVAFISPGGDIKYSPATRDKSVLLAFSAYFMLGKTDILPRLAELRSDIVPDGPLPAEVEDFYEHASTPSSTVHLFSRVLEKARQQRLNSAYGERLNKDPMLGYPTKDVKEIDRNTTACIARLQEVVTANRSWGVDFTESDVIYIEWGGKINHAAVLAAGSQSGLNIAMAMGYSGIDVGAGATARDQSIQMALPHAHHLSLERAPRITHPDTYTIVGRVSEVLKHIPGRLFLVCGGVNNLRAAPRDTVQYALEQSLAVSDMERVAFQTADFLIPRMCTNVAGRDSGYPVEEHLSCSAGCPVCESYGQGAAALVNLSLLPGARLVKQRSAYAHNAHAAVEIFSSCPDPFLATTRDTFESMVRMNVARNMDWGSPPTAKGLSGNPTSERLSDAMREVIASTFHALVDGSAHVEVKPGSVLGSIVD